MLKVICHECDWRGDETELLDFEQDTERCPRCQSPDHIHVYNEEDEK